MFFIIIFLLCLQVVTRSCLSNIAHCTPLSVVPFWFTFLSLSSTFFISFIILFFVLFDHTTTFAFPTPSLHSFLSFYCLFFLWIYYLVLLYMGCVLICKAVSCSSLYVADTLLALYNVSYYFIITLF